MSRVAGTRRGRLPARVTLMLAACAALIVGNAAVLWTNLHELERNATQINRLWATIGRLRLLRSTLALTESAYQAHLLHGETRQADAVRTNLRLFASTLTELGTLARSTPGLAAPLTELHALHAALTRDFGEPAAADTRPAAAPPEAVSPAAARTHELLLSTIDAQHARLVEFNARTFTRYRSAMALGLAIGAVTLATLIVFYVLLGRNAARRRTAEEALRQANQTLETRIAARTAQLSSLSRHLLDVAEREKAALARELHDELGSNLTAINLDVASVAAHLEKTDPVRAARLDQALRVLRQTVDLKRGIMEGLRPGMIDSLGLPETLRMHVEDFARRTGLDCKAELDTTLEDLDPGVAIALFRVAQEALTNIARYAQARHVRLELASADGELRLLIADDGVGIAADALERPLAHGLIGMRERIARLDGRFAVGRGAGGRGTRVEARVRLPHAPPTLEVAIGPQDTARS
jgi:signal transduction histidine kinase